MLGLEDLAGMFGVPGLELTVKALFKLLDVLENMKVYRAQCKRLHSRCVELLLALRHNKESLYGTEYQDAIDQADFAIQRIVRKVETWSKWGVPQSLRCQNEIKLGLDDMDRELTQCATRLNMVSHMESLHKTHQIERMLNQHHIQMEATLQRLLANTKDIHQVLTQPEPKITEQVLSLQQAIHEHTADAETINSLQERYLNIHRRKTELLPPMNDLTGEVRRISDNPVDISGGFSDVYLGEWLGNEKVALKLTRGINQTDKAQRRFMKEVGIWRQLQHKNVARLYGVATFGDLIYAVSPWMENRDALRYITLNPRVDRLKILVDVATGLEFLHRHGVVHGDLRAANILISEAEVACITDFGLSVIIEEEAVDDSSTLDMSGNSRWMAPELINPELIELHEVKRNPATDTWSYGMLCLEILTGKRPFFNRPHGPAVISDLINGVRPTRPSAEATSQGLSDGVWDLMQKCWQQNPQLRPSMSEIVRKMQAFQAARPSSSRSRTSPIPIPRHSSEVMVRTESPVSVSVSTSPSGSQPRTFTPSPSNAAQVNARENGGLNGSGPNNATTSPRVIVQGFSPLSSPRILSANHIKSASTDGVPPRARPPNISRLSSTPNDEAGARPPMLPSIGEGPDDSLEEIFRTYTLVERSFSHPLPTSPDDAKPQTSSLQVVDFTPSDGSGMSISSEASPISDVSTSPRVQKPVYIKSREDGTVEAANLPGLVERLILDSKDLRMDIQFRKTFLTSYQGFTHAETVFDLLLERFKAVSCPPHTGEQRSSVRYSVISVLDLWLRGHHVKSKDIPLLSRMGDFTLSIQREAIAAPTLKSSASRLNELIDEMVKSAAYPEPPITPLSSASSVRSTSKPPEMTPQAFASALTVLENSRFKKTIPSDYIGWLKGAGDSNEVSRFIAENNKISYWVQNNILKPDEQSQRAANLKYFLCVTEECRKLRNFSSTCALFAGLASASITNLKRTSNLDKESRVTYQKIEKLISQDKNFQAYRKALKASQVPCVPSLRVHLQDLRAIHKAHPKFIKVEGHGEHDVINFELYQHVCEHIHHILQYQEPPKPPIGSHHLEILAFIERQLRSLVIDEAWLQQRAAKRAQEELANFVSHRDELKAAGFIR